MEDRNIVIVIDPGHGGKNLGAQYETFVEKYMTLKVANRMRDVLNQFEGIDVYMTRTGDKDMDLEERVVYAAEKHADFIFCLHFNMSAEHDVYGAETWISSSPELYAKAYDFAGIEMEVLTGLGLFDRGIKTRLGSRKKNADYYGIIRHATERKIPSVIIEHCHLDHVNDQPFYHENTDAWMRTFGEADAEAVAKYFHLKSESLGVDYSEYTYEKTEIPSGIVRPDRTDPEEAVLSLLAVDQEAGTATLQLYGHDSDTRLLYYSYSFDGGETVSERFPWMNGQESVTFEIPLAEAGNREACAFVYNLFDRKTISNPVELPALEVREVMSKDVVAKPEIQQESTEVHPVSGYGAYEEIKIPPIAAQESSDSFWKFPVLSVLLLLIMLSSVFTARHVIRSDRRKKRKRHNRSE